MPAARPRSHVPRSLRGVAPALSAPLAFFKWTRLKEDRQPHYFGSQRLNGSPILAFAGAMEMAEEPEGRGKRWRDNAWPSLLHKMQPGATAGILRTRGASNSSGRKEIGAITSLCRWGLEQPCRCTLVLSTGSALSGGSRNTTPAKEIREACCPRARTCSTTRRQPGGNGGIV